MLPADGPVNHPSDPLKPRERGCFAYFHHKKWAWRRGLPWQARFLRLVAGGLPWQTPTSCLSDPKNRQTNPIYGVLVIYVSGSPPAISTQNHQNNYGQALYAVPTTSRDCRDTIHRVRAYLPLNHQLNPHRLQTIHLLYLLGGEVPHVLQFRVHAVAVPKVLALYYAVLRLVG